LFIFQDSTFKESKYAARKGIVDCSLAPGTRTQPLLFLDETIPTAGIDHMVAERKLSPLRNTSSSGREKQANVCAIEGDAFQNRQESASETHLPAETNFHDGAGAPDRGAASRTEEDSL
jgi:hypothetical protein